MGNDLVHAAEALCCASWHHYWPEVIVVGTFKTPRVPMTIYVSVASAAEASCDEVVETPLVVLQEAW